MTDDEGAAHAKLLARYRVLEEQYEGQDEFPDEIDERLGEMEKLETQPLIFDAEEIAKAGAFVTFDRYGDLAVHRGFVRPEYEPRADADVHSGEQAEDGQGDELSVGSHVDVVGYGTVITSAGQSLGANVPDDEDDGALKPLPERLVMELTAPDIGAARSSWVTPSGQPIRPAAASRLRSATATCRRRRAI